MWKQRTLGMFAALVGQLLAVSGFLQTLAPRNEILAVQSYNLRAGTEIPAQLDKDLDGRMIHDGDVFSLRVPQAIGIGGGEVIPRGAQIIGKVAVWQDQDGNYSTLVFTFQSLRMGAASLPIQLKVKALQPGRPADPSLKRPDPALPEMERRPPGDPRDPPVPQRQPYPEDGDRDPRTGEPRRRPTVDGSGGISLRKLPASDDVGPPSAIGLRRENVAQMKIAENEEGATQISIESADIAIRSGTVFRLELAKDLRLQR